MSFLLRESFRRITAYLSRERMLSRSLNAVPVTVVEDAHSLNQVSVSEEGTDVSPAEFEPVSGLVTRELRPSTDNAFTCHAFSKDGGFLATGENNGTLRLWSTFDYRCIACWSTGYGSPISAVSFYGEDSGHVIAVDKSGSLCDFFVTPDNDVSRDGLATVQRLIIRHNVGFDENLGDHPAALMHQFSADGDVLISTSHTRDEFGFGDTVVNVIEIAKDCSIEATITLRDASTCVPILSKNGKSLLILCPSQLESGNPNSPREGSRRTGIWMVPDLHEERDLHQKSRVQGDHASWGRMGQYLLVWSTGQDAYKLKVYETRHFSSLAFRDPYPIAERKLTHRLPRCMAKMFDDQFYDDSIKVMICESGDDRNIFSVWDIGQDVLTKEVKMMLSPGRSVAETVDPAVGKKILRNGSRHSPTAEKEFIETVLWNEYPVVCGEPEKKWFGAVSWIYQTINLSSASSGVTAWVSAFADELLPGPMSMPSQAMFDPSGRHLLLFGERLIQVFAPPFLDDHFQVGHQNKELVLSLTVIDGEPRCAQLLDAYCRLPSRALVRAWEIGMSDKTRSLTWFRRRRELNTRETVIDAGLSPDKQLLALILRDLRGLLYTSIRTGSFASSERKDDRKEVQFPIPVKGRDHEFSPERVFLFKTLDAEDCFAFVSTEKDPVAVFCSIDGRRQQVVQLGMAACHMICRQSKAPSVMLLDNDGVCFLNLVERRIVNRVPYRTDFSRLMDDVQEALKWCPGHGKHPKQQCHDYCISADGYAVLLAWDVNNRKSIVVEPSMRQEECRKDLLASTKSLSSLCSLSPSGAFTAFLDVDDLSHGRLTIGIFSQYSQSITFHVEVDRRLPKGLSSAGLQEVFASVFYGFDEDEKELIVNTVRVSSSSSSHSSPPETSTRSRPVPIRGSELTRSETDDLGSVPLLEDRLIIFQVHKNTRQSPNHDLLALTRGTTDDDLVERLRTSFGVSIFNLPLATNLTVFQNAILNRGEEMKSRIIDLATKQGVELAVEWERSREKMLPISRAPEGRLSTRLMTLRNRYVSTRCLPQEVIARESTDLLKWALECNRTNDIKEAVLLVCSGIAPFGSSARVIKRSLPDLLRKEYRIAKEIVCGNSLLCEVCELDVHVDFMIPELKRYRAVHVTTSDSYLEWSETKNRAVLNGLWRSKNVKKIKKMEREGNTSTTMAKLVFVRIEDAAKTGMSGIIRPLLLAQVPVHVFKTEAVKTVIQYKWCRIWRRRSLLSLLKYASFVTVFTFYAVLVVAPSDLSIGYSFREILNCSLFLAVYCSGWHMMRIQWRQALPFLREDWEFSLRGAKKLGRYIHTKGRTIDILCSTLLSVVIPSLHYLSLFHAEFEKLFAIFVAMESILVYTKIWYYVRPFRGTGSVAVMMNSIVGECVSSLGLALLYPLGFGVTLFILFSHVEKQEAPENADKLPDSTGSEEFQNFPKSLLTLFYAFLGSFEPDTYPTDGGLWSWMISLVFITYLLVQSLLLLNIVLAIMGDAYDKAKLSEEAFVLFRRAQYMDDLEAELTEKQMKEIDSRIGKYVCKVEAVNQEDGGVEEESTGRMKMIQFAVRKSIQDCEKRLEEKCQMEVDRMEKMFKENAAQMFKENAAQMFKENAAQMFKENAALIEDMRRDIAAQMFKENAALIEEMRREIAAQMFKENAALIEDMRGENAERMEQIVSRLQSLTGPRISAEEASF